MIASAFPSPELQDLPERHLAVVREAVAMDTIPDLHDRAVPLLFGALGAAAPAHNETLTSAHLKLCD